jgi:cellobiose phosphorylase
LYPLVTRSLKDALQQLRSDSLMHAFSPDWWDIGKNEGPRAYMATLIVRALREYAFISSFLGKSSPELVEYERIADAAQLALNRRLWDQQMHYLINFNGSLKDPHYYMGSLLAPVFGLLSPVRSRQLVQTAERELLAPGIGLRTAMPPDFHTDSMRAFFQFAGNEAGDPYLYANGGVWSHNNAWYVLALRSVGRLDDAFRFFRATMTLDGIASSPMGQPAMYEYRYSDPASEEYGRIDKPSFLWAAGFSLFTAYRLIGIDDNEWNVSFSGTLPSGLDSIRCQFAFGEKKQITISGRQSGLRSFAADDVAVPSLVVPLDVRSTARWELRTGKLTTPYLERINAVLHSAHFDENARTLRLSIASFPGHHVSAMVIAAARPRAVIVDGRKVKDVEVHVRPGGTVSALLHFSGVASRQTVVVQF